MKTNFKTFVVECIIAAAITTGIFFLVFSGNAIDEEQLGREIEPSAKEKGLLKPAGTINQSVKSPPQKKPSLKSTDGLNEEMREQLVKKLREAYGESISIKSGQAEIVRIRQLILDTFPQDWPDIFYNIIKQAFPDYVDEIMETLERMDQYNAWFDKNKSMLAKMSYEKMKETLWLKRIEIFEDNADEVWPADSKNDEIRDTLSILKASYDTSIDEKLNLYQHSLENNYSGSEENTDNLILDKKYNYMAAFLNMDSVQENLTQMTSDERTATLRKIRQTMGYPEEYLEKLEKRDAYHENRWQNGLNYMQVREQILLEYENSDDLEERMDGLRESYFMDEAPTIKSEEESNFFRYERRRVYGRN